VASLANGYPFAILKKVKEGQLCSFPSYLFQFWGNPQAPYPSHFKSEHFLIKRLFLAKALEKIL